MDFPADEILAGGMREATQSILWCVISEHCRSAHDFHSSCAQGKRRARRWSGCGRKTRTPGFRSAEQSAPSQASWELSILGKGRRTSTRLRAFCSASPPRRANSCHRFSPQKPDRARPRTTQQGLSQERKPTQKRARRRTPENARDYSMRCWQKRRGSTARPSGS